MNRRYFFFDEPESPTSIVHWGAWMGIPMVKPAPGFAIVPMRFRAPGDVVSQRGVGALTRPNAILSDERSSW